MFRRGVGGSSRRDVPGAVRALAAWISVVIVATLVPFTPAPPAAAVEAPVTCWQTWVGPATGPASWNDPVNWSPAGVPSTDSTACFGAAFGGSAVNGVRITLPSTTMVDQLRTDDDAEITLVAGELTVLAVADIDGVRLDGARYVYNNPAVLAAGGTAGGRGVFAGPLTVEAGATMSGDELVFEGSVANEGTIIGPTPQTAEDGSVIVVAGSYAGGGRLVAPVLQLRSGASVQSDASADVTISTAAVDSDADLFLPAGQVGLIDAHGRVGLGAGVRLRQLHLTEPAVVELLDGATIEPDAVTASGNVMITGNGTLRPGTLEVSVLEQQSAFRRGDATALPVVAGPIGRAAIPVVIVRRASADTAERWGDPDAVGLRRAGGASTAPGSAVPSIATSSGSNTLLRDGLQAQGFTLFGSITVEARTSTSIGAGAEFSQGPNTRLGLSGETTFVMDAAAVAPFGRLANGSDVAIDGCFVVQADREYLTGTGPALAFMDGGTFDVTATIVSATRPVDGGRWEIEFETPNLVPFRGAGVRAAAGDPEFGEYRLQSVLGAANPTSCDAPPQEVTAIPAGTEFSVLEGDTVSIPLVSPAGPLVPVVTPVVVLPPLPGQGDVTDFVSVPPFVLGTAVPLQLATVDDDFPEGIDEVRLLVGGVPVTVRILEDDLTVASRDVAGESVPILRLGGPDAAVAEGTEVPVELLLAFGNPLGMEVTWRTSFDPDLLDPDAVPADAGDVELVPGDPDLLTDVRYPIPELTTSVPFRLRLTSDDEIEPAEQFAIVADIDGLPDVFDPVFVVTIESEVVIEPLTLTLSPLPAEVREGDGEVTFEVVVTGGAPGINLFFPVTAATNGDEPDWASGVGITVTGPGAYPVRLSVIDDEVIEQPEPYVVRIGDPIPTADVTHVVRERTGILLDDDSAPEVGVTISDPAVLEADSPPGSSGVDGTIEVVFRATGDLGTAPISVPFTVEGVGDLPITPGDDVTPATGTVVIDPSDPQDPVDPGAVTIVLAAPDDDLYEGTETYRIVLGEPEGATLDPAASSAEGTILDDEPLPVVSLSIEDAFAAERDAEDTIVLTVEMSGRSERIVTIPILAAGVGTLAVTPVADLALGSMVVGLSGARTQHSVVIAARDDVVYEGDETVEFTLGEIAGAATSPTSATARATVIDDEDAPAVTLTFADRELVEGEQTVLRIAFDPLAHPTERPIEVEAFVLPDPDAPLIVGADVTIDTAGEVEGGWVIRTTLDAGRPTTELDVSAANDELIERPGRVTVVIANVTIGGALIPVDLIGDGLTILDAQRPQIEIEVDQRTRVIEGGTLRFDVSSTSRTAGPLVALIALVGIADDGAAAATPGVDAVLPGATVIGDALFLELPLPPGGGPVAVTVDLPDDGTVEGDEVVEIRQAAALVDGVLTEVDPSSDPVRFTIVDPTGVAARVGLEAVGPVRVGEGGTFLVDVTNDDAVAADGELVVVLTVRGSDSGAAEQAHPATDVQVVDAGTAIGAVDGEFDVFVRMPSDGSSARVRLDVVDDVIAEPLEAVEVSIAGVLVDGVIRAGDVVGEPLVLTIVDDDDPADAADEAAQVAELREGLIGLPDVLRSWAALFDLAPSAWDGEDPVDLPVASDRLATIAEAESAVGAAVEQMPRPAATDENWDEVVERFTNPDGDDTPNEPDEGACAVVHVVRGIGGLPTAPSGDLIELRCETTLGDLAAAAGLAGRAQDRWNDATPGVLEALAGQLGLDGDGTFTADTRVVIVFGVDTEGFYVDADTGLMMEVATEQTVTGTGAVFGQPDVEIDGTAEATLSVRLGPAGTGRLRAAQLAGAAADLLVPTISGGATAVLPFVHGDDEFEWTGTWSVASAGGVPAVSLDEQRLRLELRVPGLDTGVVDRPDRVVLVGEFADGVWTVDGTMTQAALAGFRVTNASFHAIVDGSGLRSATADLELILNEDGEAVPVIADVHLAIEPDGWHLTGTALLGSVRLSHLMELEGAEVVVDVNRAGVATSGGVSLLADTAVVFPTDDAAGPGAAAGDAPRPQGLISATGVSGTILGDGSVSFDAATAVVDVRGGAVRIGADAVSVRTGPAFAALPVLQIGEADATFAALPSTLVTITGLQVLQDGRVGVASAEVDRAGGFFADTALDDLLPFDVTSVRLDFTTTVPGTDPPLRALDDFDVTVTGGFDQVALDAWPFVPRLQLGGTTVTPTSDPAANSFVFQVSIESLADGVLRPLDLGPIGIGFDDLAAGDSLVFGGQLTLGGWQDGELLPSLSGEVEITDGIEADDPAALRVAITGTALPGALALDAVFDLSGRWGPLAISDLELAFSLVFGLDVTGAPYAEVAVDTVSLGEASLGLGPWAEILLGDATLDLDAGPDEPALVVGGDPSDPTSGLGVRFLPEFDELAGWGGRVGGIVVCGDLSIHATDQTYVALDIPEDAELGLPPELPVFLDEAGLILDVDAEPGDPCSGGSLSDLDDVIVRVSGGVRATDSWPLEFALTGLEVSLARLTGLQPGFPILNLDEISFGMEPQELGAGVTIGGQVALGSVTVDGQEVFYLQVEGAVGVSGIEFGGNVVITEYGPVIMALQAPVGIPIGPTGLVLSSVAAGVQFGVELPSIDEPLDLLGLPISPVDADVDRDAIIDAIRPVLGGGALWDRPFSIAGTGFITSIASPGMAGGEVTFGMNIGFRPGDGAKLFARGDLTAFGIPVGGGGIFVDLSSPVEPIIDVAFALPGPQAGPISFVMPSEGQFTMRIDTTGVAPAAAIAVRTFLNEVLNGSVEIGGAAFSQAVDAMAAELDEARHRPLARFLLDVNGDGVVSDAEDAVPLTSAMVFTRLLAMLPSSPSAASALLATNPDLVTAVIGELLIALDGVSVGGEVPADLLAAFGEGQRTMAAFVAMVSKALRDGGTAALDVFDPSVTISGSIQPMILGIPFGEPEAAGTLTINRDGITVGYSISVTKLVQRLGEMIVPFVGGEIVTLLTVGGVDRWDLTAQLPLGGFVESLVTGTVAPGIDPNDGRWAISGQGRIGLLGYELTGADLIVTAPQNQTFVDQRVQRLFDPVTGQPMDISPVQIDTDKIPIVTKADYDNLLKYGGILVSGRLQVPGMIVDPLTLVKQIGPAPAKADDTLGWLRQVAETVTAPATPVRGTLFLPSPQILLTQQLDAIGDDRFSVNTAAANFVSDAGAWLRAASFNGVYEGMFMSIPAFKATVRGSATGLSINGTVPLLGVRSTFQVAMRDQAFPGGVTLPIPTVELRTRIDPTAEGSLLNELGVPADFDFISGSLELQILSPGFDPRSRDAFERQGGTRVIARANVEGIVEDAEIVVGVLVPSNPVAGADFDLEVRADQLGIVGFGITEPELVFRKRGFDILGELHGRATVLGASASVDGEFSTTTGGSLTLTFDSGTGPTLSGFHLSATASLACGPGPLT